MPKLNDNRQFITQFSRKFIYNSFGVKTMPIPAFSGSVSRNKDNVLQLYDGGRIPGGKESFYHVFVGDNMLYCCCCYIQVTRASRSQFVR